MSFLSQALTSVGTALLGKGISAGAKYVFKNFLPQGAQSFLSGIGDSLGIGSKDVSAMSDEVAKAYLGRKKELLGREGPDPRMLSVGSSMAAGQMAKAGQAQLIPLGGTDRVSRALQDARVAEKIMRMSGQAPIPSPNLRGGQTIGLSSATPPSTRLSKKFS